MSVYTSKKTYDCWNGAPVPVIASFNSKGEIAPLYVRLQEERYQILQYSVRMRWSNVIEYSCTINNHGKETSLILSYFKIEDVWCIPVNSGY